jgi:hypothetical protein
MAIPDEVAQYAEGHRIVSYFSLGSVRDGDQQKDTWLWTTVGDGHHPYDFDSFRVFAWSVHRHRYETEYIERNVIGYSPVEIQPVRFSGGNDEYAGSPGFRQSRLVAAHGGARSGPAAHGELLATCQETPQSSDRRWVPIAARSWWPVCPA